MTPDPALQACMQACRDCHTACLAEIQHCLTLGGDHAEPTHVGLLLDCAGVCAVTADLLTTNSRFFRQQCAVCARVCTTCAQQCRALGRMDDCVHACERCAQACERLDVSAGESG